jgi:hypothetical protein
MRDLLFHLPDKALILLAMLMLVRLGLPKPLPVIGRITEPLLVLARFITPRGFPDTVLIVFAMIWFLALRVVFHVQMGSFGLLPGQTP